MMPLLMFLCGLVATLICCERWWYWKDRAVHYRELYEYMLRARGEKEREG